MLFHKSLKENIINSILQVTKLEIQHGLSSSGPELIHGRTDTVNEDPSGIKGHDVFIL